MIPTSHDITLAVFTGVEARSLGAPPSTTQHPSRSTGPLDMCTLQERHATYPRQSFSHKAFLKGATPWTWTTPCHSTDLLMGHRRCSTHLAPMHWYHDIAEHLRSYVTATIRSSLTSPRDNDPSTSVWSVAILSTP
eukprot:3457308-Amphidinium_carterae.2